MRFTKNWDTGDIFKSCFNAAMRCRLPQIRSSALCKTNNAKRIRKAITDAWLKRCAMQNSCSAVRFSSIPPAEDCCCEHLHFLVLFYQGIFLRMQCVCLCKDSCWHGGYIRPKKAILPPSPNFCLKKTPANSCCCIKYCQDDDVWLTVAYTHSSAL